MVSVFVSCCLRDSQRLIKGGLGHVACSYACARSHFSCVQLCETLWTVACQAPTSMEFSRQEYWSGLPCPPLQEISQA